MGTRGEAKARSTADAWRKFSTIALKTNGKLSHYSSIDSQSHDDDETPSSSRASQSHVMKDCTSMSMWISARFFEEIICRMCQAPMLTILRREEGEERLKKVDDVVEEEIRM